MKNISGNWHWKAQRITAAIMIPLFMWATFQVIQFFISPEYEISEFLYEPLHIFLICTIAFISLYHGALGISSVLDDYVPNESLRRLVVSAMYAFTILTFVVLLIAFFLNYQLNYTD